MKNKKHIILFIILFLIILIVGCCTIKKLKSTQEETIEEYTPEEEISEEEEENRNTIVTVYYLNKETKEIMPEARIVDVRDVVNNPYQKLLELLIEGPTSDKLEKTIPQNTIILGTSIEEDCVTINLSSGILEYEKTDNTKENMIKSIVNTLTELTEVTKVKILVEGQENQEFSEIYERTTN